ncbi:M18 family aminopeptidase [Desulfofustis limnaeus]|jgi:aspartyl aminopeptidase|uniref:M18 family aminopeptidase n=1 Tax=Desulfofustis limnaeus TaxID=2740163 RepID=A0ABM7W8S8_9BACT|nr:M18 family aminopeptidase [Desulfofustis limnaeus]MDX9894205.1 M18 family aminopeptidase [Desulfofustis sp.]BDD87289.1 putative M18 family aminopeptidase 2 [Desulfofustis limnaeus]
MGSGDNLISSLFSFLSESPTAYHAAASIRRRLLAAGFIEVAEDAPNRAFQTARWFVVRNGAVAAFARGEAGPSNQGLRIVGAHTDSPSLKIKPNLRQDRPPYLVAGVEAYGGALFRSWFDRELSVAGRVCCRTENGDIDHLLVDFEVPLVFIPSLAIHLDRKVNEGQPINVQTDLNPIIGMNLDTDASDLTALLQRHLEKQYPTHKAGRVLSFELFCYDPSRPRLTGLDQCFITGPRLDNLLSCHVAVEALCTSRGTANCLLLCLNHEEIGSLSSSGAAGSFATQVLARLLPDREERAACLYKSFLLSLDNSHATHPNYRDKSDEAHPVLLNHGPVIKINAAQRYSTTAGSAALFKIIADEVGVHPQEFVMRSDMACGTTIGPMASAALGVEAVDVGVPTWGMHAIREMTGSTDPELLLRVVTHFCNRSTLPKNRHHW